MVDMNSERVKTALLALAEQMEFSGDAEYELVVCGGSALQMLGLVDRTTKDVDILAIAQRASADSLELISAEPLPTAIVKSAETVARDLGLQNDWLNSGPTDLLKQGLPEGLVDRLHSQRYGNSLVVHFIDRFDQLCLKLYATVNSDAYAHHLSDLLILKPSDDEIITAATWCLTQDASETFPPLVISCLDKIGYANAAREIKRRISE